LVQRRAGLTLPLPGKPVLSERVASWIAAPSAIGKGTL
jgi:hypothetical protein